MALYDALNCASLAIILAEDGNQPKAEEAYMEASVAAMDAFPPCTPESRALNLILGKAGEAVARAAA